MLEGFTVGTFSERVGGVFIAHRDASEASEVELAAVSEEGEGPGGRPFSLVFRGSDGIPLSQGTYRMEHERIGVFELFLVPIGISPDGEGLLYEAVFN